MSAYVIVEIEVTDLAGYEEYRRLAESTIPLYGGRYIVRGGQTETLEGDWQPKRIVILEFESVARAKEWWDSPEYSEAKVLRQKYANSRMIVVEGYTL
jgi:uncharacterized protein (DUF1330 family)